MPNLQACTDRFRDYQPASDGSSHAPPGTLSAADAPPGAAPFLAQLRAGLAQLDRGLQAKTREACETQYIFFFVSPNSEIPKKLVKIPRNYCSIFQNL